MTNEETRKSKCLNLHKGFLLTIHSPKKLMTNTGVITKAIFPNVSDKPASIKPRIKPRVARFFQECMKNFLLDLVSDKYTEDIKIQNNPQIFINSKLISVSLMISVIHFQF
jgi:hypothetical protein